MVDVSYFVTPGTPVDDEAAKRATTVYLVDRTIPMLPRPLCEIACSLNENVERLAFSCVWKMNMDGTMGNKIESKAEDDQVWYGRTVIRSCARLDYATAQNIIDKKVAYGEDENAVDDQLWPKSRRPTGGHTTDEVAADVRFMHKVAMARRKLRYEHGAIALNGTKLTFQLENDGQTPSLCEPYPIRDSNRLIEEYMLLANFLVAQKLITSAGGLALLRFVNSHLVRRMRIVLVPRCILNHCLRFSFSKTSSSTDCKWAPKCY
jgi:exoribonuclease R